MNPRANLIRKRRAAKKLERWQEARMPKAIPIRLVKIDAETVSDTAATDFVLFCAPSITQEQMDEYVRLMGYKPEKL